MRLRRIPVVCLLLCTGCIPPPQNHYRARTAPPAPCGPSVSPIRYQSIYAVVNFNFTYTPKDASSGRDALRTVALQQLNSLGASDGDHFSEPNGQQTNFYLNYSLSNDGQDHFTGSVNLSGWGQGDIHTFSRYQYPYSGPVKLTTDLTDDLYTFIHGGWHDTRAQCRPGYTPPGKASKKKKKY